MSAAPVRPEAHGVDAPSYGLAPRPPVDPVVLAVVAAAVDQAWPRPVVAAEARPAGHPWRFSGRWWAQPVLVRRDRPRIRRAG